MENKYYGVKVPFLEKEDYVYVTIEGGLPWYTVSLKKAQALAGFFSSEAIVVELTEEDLLE